MKAVFIEEFGSVDVLQYGDRPQPRPGSRQVIIEVHAASINPRDWLMREGKYIFKKFAGKMPIILGSDVSGVVVEVGSKVMDWNVGDEVFGMKEMLNGMMGAYAEYIAIDERKLVFKPTEITHEEAAGAPLASLTAIRLLVRHDREGLSRLDF